MSDWPQVMHARMLSCPEMAALPRVVMLLHTQIPPVTANGYFYIDTLVSV
jgi:hypothetical protein